MNAAKKPVARVVPLAEFEKCVGETVEEHSARRTTPVAEDLTPVVANIASVVGVEAAVRLVELCGGTTRYVPRTPTPEHDWAKAIGDEAIFKRLCSVFGGRMLSLPRTARGLGYKKRAVIELAERGLPTPEIARRADCTERYVNMVLGLGFRPGKTGAQ